MSAYLAGFAVLSFPVLLTQTGGCSGGPENRTLTTTALFAQAYAQTLCESLRHCCNENEVPYDQARCTAGWKDVLTKRLSNPISQANYDSRAATQCLKLVSTAATVTCDPDPGSISDARDVCQKIFAGKKPLGAKCTSSAECAPQPGQYVGCEGQPLFDPDSGVLPLSVHTSLSPQAAPPGPPVCVALTPIEPGQRCNTPALVSLCDYNPLTACDLADGICKAVAGAGQPCGVGGCKPGLFCDQGTCSPKGGAGDKCASNDQCTNSYRCDTGRGVCTDRLRPGDACTRGDDCTAGVCDTGTRRCLKNAIATSQSCTGTDVLRP